MGTPNNTIWPGCSHLPEFKCIFPKWEPRTLPKSIIDYKAHDIFLVSFYLFISIFLKLAKENIYFLFKTENDGL